MKQYGEEIRRTQHYVNTWVREVAFDEMTNHRFVTPDRLVQETEFASGRGVVNFGDAPYRTSTSVAAGVAGGRQRH